MKKDEALDIQLPKWPALVVIGKDVTKEQADEIIIRTDGLAFSSNDREFIPQFLFAMKYVTEEERDILFGQHMTSMYLYVNENDSDILKALKEKVEKKIDRLGKQLNSLRLGYLENQRILSAWVGGPHGWCDWTGRIFSNNYNIGKWPSIEEVLKDWEKIAHAFPFLDLKCQLHNGEECEDNTKPLIQFNVKHGKVEMVEPEALYIGTAGFNEKAVFDIFTLSASQRERGIQPEDLAEKIQFLLKKRTISSRGKKDENALQS